MTGPPTTTEIGEISIVSEVSIRHLKAELRGARAHVGIPRPPPAHEQVAVQVAGTSTDSGSAQHHSSGLLSCVGPNVVARLSDVISWMRACPDGENVNNEPYTSHKPPRLALRKESPPPFIMISYTQLWCKFRWSKMVAVLEQLERRGWVYVWMDCVVLNVALPYSQAQFEQAMRFAVEQSAAVFCPMSKSYQESLGYLSRPWCSYESMCSIRRGAFWINQHAAVTSIGRWKRFAALSLATCLMLLILIADWFKSRPPLVPTGLWLGYFGAPVVALNASSSPQGNTHCYPSVASAQLDGLTAGPTRVLWIYFLAILFDYYWPSWLPALANLGGGSLLYDLGDAAVLGELTERGAARSAFEQMLLWHISRTRASGARGWPMDWCVLARTADEIGASRRIWIEGDTGDVLCRAVDGHAIWLDGQSEDAWGVPQMRTCRAFGHNNWFFVVIGAGRRTVHAVVPTTRLGSTTTVLGLTMLYLVPVTCIRQSRLSAHTQLALDTLSGTAIACATCVYLWTAFGGLALQQWLCRLPSGASVRFATKVHIAWPVFFVGFIFLELVGVAIAPQFINAYNAACGGPPAFSIRCDIPTMLLQSDECDPPMRVAMVVQLLLLLFAGALDITCLWWLCQTWAREGPRRRSHARSAHITEEGEANI